MDGREQTAAARTARKANAAKRREDAFQVAALRFLSERGWVLIAPGVLATEGLGQLARYGWTPEASQKV